jgi:hypothetical protein
LQKYSRKEVFIWFTANAKVVTIHGISVQIAQTGLLLIMMKVPQNQLRENYAMNAKQKKKLEHVPNNLLSELNSRIIT